MRPSLTTPSPTSETLPAWPGRRAGAGARDRAATPFALPDETARPATQARESGKQGLPVAPTPRPTAQAREPSPARRHDAEGAAGDRRQAASRQNGEQRTARTESRERPGPAGTEGRRRADHARKADSPRDDQEMSPADDAAAAEETDADPTTGSDGAPDGAVLGQPDGLPVDPDGKGASDEEQGDTEDSDEKSDATDAEGTGDAVSAALAALVSPAEPATAKPDGSADAAPSACKAESVTAVLSKDQAAPAGLIGDAAQPSVGDSEAGADVAAVKDGAAPDPGASKPEAGSRKAAPEHEKTAHRHLESLAPAPEFKADAASTNPAPPAHLAAQAGATGQAGQANPAGQSAQANAAAQAQAVPVLNQVPLGAVPIEIGLKSLSGMNRFEIRLDPAELGRIDVRLDIGDGGDVKAHLVVDRVETLALLQRDAKTLERAFEQAGLKPSEGSIDLSLRDPGGDRRGTDQGGNEQGRRAAPKGDDVQAVERVEAVQQPRRMMWRGASGVDLRI